MTKSAHAAPPPDTATRRRAPPVLTYSVSNCRISTPLSTVARAELSKVAELAVPPRNVRTFEVTAGQFFRMVSVEGPQVGDLN